MNVNLPERKLPVPSEPKTGRHAQIKRFDIADTSGISRFILAAANRQGRAGASDDTLPAISRFQGLVKRVDPVGFEQEKRGQPIG
jgi:hypothetical protein